MPSTAFVHNEYIDDSNHLAIYVIDLKEINADLKNTIDSHILRVCEGRNPYGTTISEAKSKIKSFLENKLDDNPQPETLNKTYMGAVAEFFIHIFLNHLGFEQECTFKNLEERSIKKGFDGYYSDDNKTWIMESKSGLSTSTDISHESKLAEAYRQLNHKITTCNSEDNNPWENAFHHAKVVDSKESILKQLKELSNKFVSRKINNNIEEFNLIPCSTIFYFENWEDEREHIIMKAKNFATTKLYSNMIIICLNKKCMNLLLDYLEG